MESDDGHMMSHSDSHFVKKRRLLQFDYCYLMVGMAALVQFLYNLHHFVSICKPHNKDIYKEPSHSHISVLKHPKVRRRGGRMLRIKGTVTNLHFLCNYTLPVGPFVLVAHSTALWKC